MTVTALRSRHLLLAIPSITLIRPVRVLSQPFTNSYDTTLGKRQSGWGKRPDHQCWISSALDNLSLQLTHTRKERIRGDIFQRGCLCQIKSSQGNYAEICPRWVLGDSQPHLTKLCLIPTDWTTADHVGLALNPAWTTTLESSWACIALSLFWMSRQIEKLNFPVTQSWQTAEIKAKMSDFLGWGSVTTFYFFPSARVAIDNQVS